MASGYRPESSSPRSFAAGTLVFSDELPKAIVLANSFLRFHPGAIFAVLVVDGSATQASIPNAEVLSLADLGLHRGEEWRLPMLFSGAELRSVLQPALLEMLLRTYGNTAAYFSPATQIFADLTDVFEMIRQEEVILATEFVRNEEADAGRSFIGASSAGKDLSRDWFERMRAIRVSGLPAEKESAPDVDGLFETVPHRVIRLPALGVDYSNLEAALLGKREDKYEIDGHPLLSFDFRGYDPAKPHLLSRYLGVEPRILLSAFPLVAELCDAYREQLLAAGHSVPQTRGRPFERLPSGLVLDPRMRRLYSEAFFKFHLGQVSEPPSPFGPAGEDGFVKWLNEPVDRAGEGVTRYMMAIYQDRPDVQAAFPDPGKADAAAFRGWYLTFGSREFDLPAAVVPRRESLDKVVEAPASVNVAGYFRAELGIGVAARSLVAAMEAAGIPINTVTFNRTANRLAHTFPDRSANAGSADTNIVCVNPDQIALFAEQAGPEFSHGRYSIGVWFWEAEDFPAEFHGAFNYVDEIWVASEFMHQTFLKVSPKPVFKFRLPVLAPTIDESLTRSQLGLPDKFIFLFSFDFLSVLERKNPLGLIRAFTRAFASGEGPSLVIKTINGDKRTIELEKLKYAVRDRPDIVLRDGYLAAVENATVTALSDCYVSLHRSEGFGFTMAEAMMLAKPVIATAYSGNLEFMTTENSYLCPSQRCQVGPEREPYPAESYWSEPDTAAAADLLRQVYFNQEEARERGRRAAEDLRSRHSAAFTGKIIAQRLAVIRQRRSAALLAPVRSREFFQDQVAELQERLRKYEPDSEPR
jgi:glycosyltransferase involved in cell wall biosynthesis